MRLSKKTLPEAGTIYSVRLKDGKFGAAKVVAVRMPHDSNLPSHMREFAAFVCATAFLGDSEPRLDDKRIKNLLKRQTGSRTGVWVGEPPPANFAKIGIVPVDRSEVEKIPASFSGWEWITGTIGRELAGHMPEVGAAPKPATAVMVRARLELERKDGFFREWEEHHPAAAVRKVRTAGEQLINALRRRDPVAKDGLQTVRDFVGRVNEIAATHPIINSIERDDLVDLVSRAAKAFGLNENQALKAAEESRDW